MGNYGADPNPDVLQTTYVGRGLSFIPSGPLLGEVWSLSSASAISSYRTRSRIHRCKIKYDPREVPTHDIP